MERIDFYEKKEALHKEMLSYIREALEISGGSIEFSGTVLGYILVSPDGYESTKELAIDEIRNENGYIRFHDANAFDESNSWIDSDELMYCCLDNICDHIYTIIKARSQSESFTKQRREEFTDYVETVFPGYGSRIDWDYFSNLDTMEHNLMEQVRLWLPNS